MIELEHVSFQYDGDESQGSLMNLDLTIQTGECVLLCGPSGCGKSTIIRLLNGLIPHFFEGKLQGNIKIDGQDITKQELYDTAKTVGTVFQNPRSQFFNVDTTSELAFECENMGLEKNEIMGRVQETVEKVHIEKLMNRNIFGLSGGEKQKIACACVMSANPDVILLDEPSANLDQGAICDLRWMIKQWRKEGKTIVIAEHRLAYCLNQVDRIVVLGHGKIRRQLSRLDFLALTEKEVHRMGLRSKQEMDAHSENGDSHESKEYMTIRNLCFGYEKKNKVLDYKEVQIPVGEIVAIVGPNGTGKSTFLRCLCGMEKKCKAVLQYKDCTYCNKERMKLIYMVMQDVNHQLFTESVLDEVLISMDEEKEEKALQILEKLDLEQYKDRHPVSLSGGQKQRVAVASAIASKREIILFDEPTSGLDYEHMQEVAMLLRELQQSGKTILVVTHDAELIRSCCTKVIHLDQLKDVG